MRVIQISEKQELLYSAKDPRDNIYTNIDTLIVEMTQEEYQLACHIIIEAQKKK